MKPIKSFAIIGMVITMMMGLSVLNANAQSKHALLIGISDYGNDKENPNMWANINGANDVKLLQPLFVKQGFKVTSIVNSNATYVAITKALDGLAKSCKKGDLVYIHFSMHGQLVDDLNGDEKDGWDEALIPVDAQMRYAKGVYEGENHLIDDILEKHFNKIRTKLGTGGQLYVVLDACHSGTASRGDDEYVRGVFSGFSHSGKIYTPDRTSETNDYFHVPTQAGQSPVTFIEACRSYQQNKEVRDKNTNMWYGSLSYYVAQSMKNNAIDKSGKWIEDVKKGMDNDTRLRKQNMVIEKSK